MPLNFMLLPVKGISRILIAFSFSVSILLFSCKDSGSNKPEIEKIGSGDFTRKLTVDGRDRTYLIHVPTSYDGSKPFPVVLVFHGGGSNAPAMIELTGLNQMADNANFIAVYPNGTGEQVGGVDVLAWNGGPRQPYGQDPDLSQVDDVRYTSALLDDVAAVASIDAKRVYATGMSGGAILTYRLASELSNRIAAIATVAGPMGTETCNPERPVSVMHFHGTADEAVPFHGGKGRLDPTGTEFQSVEYSIGCWTNANGCQQIPEITQLPQRVNDGTMVSQKSYTGCQQSSEVILYIIEGGGHTWPNRPFGPGYEILGKATKNVSANGLMWAFFKGHPLP